MSTPRPDRDITRRRAQEAWAKLRALQEPDIGSRHVLAGDGGVTVDLAGTMLMIGRVSATGRPIIALNPTRRLLGMGQLIEVLPMAETAPATWRVPPIAGEVFWIAGAVTGQTPGLFTPAHQFAFSVFDAAPDPLVPYQFYLRGNIIYRITPDGQVVAVAGGGATIPSGGLIINALDADLTSDGVAGRTLEITPGGNGVLVGFTAEAHEVIYATDVIPDPFNPPNDTIRNFIRYEYDQVELFSLEFTSPIQIRNIRLRMTVNYEYIFYVGLPPLDGRSDGGVIPSPYAEIIMPSDHFDFARYNPVNGLLFIGGDAGHIITVPWNPATIPPASDPVVTGVMHFFTPSGMYDIAFDAAGHAYVATGWQVWRWNYETDDSVVLVAGDGAFPANAFPVDGAPATSGSLGNFDAIGGIAIDALGRLLIACNGSFPEGSRLAAVNLTTGTITTLTGFGRPNDATENLVEPLATAVFTGMNSLQVDSAGRPYIGGEQVKRIGA